jgi:hypothetical protein
MKPGHSHPHDTGSERQITNSNFRHSFQSMLIYPAENSSYLEKNDIRNPIFFLLLYKRDLINSAQNEND